MKTLWTALSIIAVANILALLGLGGFLAQSGRLSRERVDRARAIFVVPVAKEAAAQEAAEAEARRAQEEAERAARIDLANPGVEQRNDDLHTMEQMLREKLDRANRDLQALRLLLDSRMAEIERRERDLVQREAAFQDEVQRVRALQADEQFQKAVALLAGLKPEDLKAKLDVYLTEGRTQYVVDVLDALPTRVATKLLAEYQTQSDNAVAADLLLRLKERGVGAPPAEGAEAASALPATPDAADRAGTPPDADPPANEPGKAPNP